MAIWKAAEINWYQSCTPLLGMQNCCTGEPTVAVLTIKQQYDSGSNGSRISSQYDNSVHVYSKASPTELFKGSLTCKHA